MTADITMATHPDRPALAARIGRYLVMPAFIAATCASLFAYLSQRELDTIEAPRLSSEFIIDSILRHLFLVGASTVLVIAIAVPLGVLLTRPFARALAPPFVTVANTGQAIPSFGVIVLFALTLGFGVRYAIYALTIYALLPVLRNTMVGLTQVDPSIIEAGRGMGMSKRAVLTKIELPLAIPVMLAGVRTALVINVGTAAIVTLTNAGGLGDIIYAGLVTNRTLLVVTGGVLTAALALLVDYVAAIAENVLRPRGL